LLPVVFAVIAFSALVPAEPYRSLWNQCQKIPTSR
jgi:hypothetical protein